MLKRGLSVQFDKKLNKILEGPLRPPGALDEVEFLSTCTRCNACVEACPHLAIVKQPQSAGLAAGAPMIDPQKQPCMLCDGFPCVSACEPKALRPFEKVEMGTAVIDPEHCLVSQDQVCTLCFDACPYPFDAIEIDQDFAPQILSGCVGCGQCVRVCPTFPAAIQCLSPTQHRRKELEDRVF